MQPLNTYDPTEVTADLSIEVIVLSIMLKKVDLSPSI